MARGTRILYELKARKGEIAPDDPTLKFLRAKDKIKLIILGIIGILVITSWWFRP